MAYIKKLRGRGVSGVVTAYGEVLFMPGGDVNRWTNRFAARIGAETRKAAPSNRRPRWAHYGKPLKATVTASRPEYRPARGGGRVYAAVGSTAPYAYYVDQGTGVYGGNGPYPAKVLPPWEQGSPSLYEHTWRPGGPGTRKVGTVMIKGQRGQGFFDTGLTRGFARMRMRSFQVPGEGIRGMTDALGSFPRGLEFDGNTPVTAGFIASLQEWRAWRDAAWNAQEALGRGKTKPVKERKARPPKAVKPPKAPKPPKVKGPKKTPLERAIAAAKNEMRLYKMRHPQVVIAGFNAEGFLVISGTGQQQRIYWSTSTADLFVEAGEYV